MINLEKGQKVTVVSGSNTETGEFYGFTQQPVPAMVILDSGLANDRFIILPLHLINSISFYVPLIKSN